jgi:flagellar hook-associated protein 2
MAGNINHLDWSPAADTGQLKQSAGDAAFRFDGVDMTSASNTVTGLPAGMTLTLTRANPGTPTQIAFAPKGEQIASLMKDLVLALNDITSQLNESADPMGGELGNDAGARALKRSLAGLAGTVVMPNAAPGEPRTLGDLGLALNRDGTFRFDGERLDKTLTDSPVAAGAMFTVGMHGVYSTIDKLARTIGSPTDPGSLGGSVTRYTRMKGEIAERLSDIAEKQEALRAQLSKSFTVADRNISLSNSTLSFLKGQIAVWNASDD